ncbi:MAG: hypothetical protein U9O86_01075 [Campylobacterota bacterium]|nr:hypothetical protein [Campylobacterota bacterium]
MQNPFESGHIKNYLLLYASVVVIMILFFIASSLFNEVETIEKKEFNTEIKQKPLEESTEKNSRTQPKPKFKLLEKAY